MMSASYSLKPLFFCAIRVVKPIRIILNVISKNGRDDAMMTPGVSSENQDVEGIQGGRVTWVGYRFGRKHNNE
jgi:hypothetical protein